MAAKKGFAEAVMVLRKRRYRGIIEITSDEERSHDVLDEWQTLYTPPEGADPMDMHLESWEPLPGKPERLPSCPIKPGRSILIWKSEQMSKFWIVTMAAAPQPLIYDVEVDGPAEGMTADEVIKATRSIVLSRVIREGGKLFGESDAQPNPNEISRSRARAMTNDAYPAVYVWQID